jgi:hypothetical protein
MMFDGYEKWRGRQMSKAGRSLAQSGRTPSGRRGVSIRGKRDANVDEIAGVLDGLVKDYPEAEVTVRRTNPGSIRVRVIDPSFRRMSETRRDGRVWKYLKQLPPDVLGFVSMVLPFTPEEAQTSLLNHDFEHPVRLRI